MWQRTPRWLLMVVYRLTIRVATAVVAPTAAVTVYLRGSFGRGDPVLGLSDVDMVAVIDDRAQDVPDSEHVTARWERVRKLLPIVGGLVSLEVCRRSELLESMRGSTHLPRSEGGEHRAVHQAQPRPPVELLVRPGLFEVTGDWSPVRGDDLRPARQPWPDEHRGLVAWLELQHWWRHAVRLAVVTEGRRSSYRALRVIIEPARAWLWFVHGVRTDGRPDVLRRAEALLPESTQMRPETHAALELAATLLGDPRRPQPVDRGVVLAWIQEMTRLVAAALVERASACDATTVRLLGGRGTARTCPLVDWRAIVVPPRAIETFTLGVGRPDEPGAVEAAFAAYRPGHYHALRDGAVLVKPAATWGDSMLRSVHLPLSDPVSFALADGAEAAVFPELPGWSARDVAGRAITEHGAFLARRPSEFNTHGVVLLLSALRASLFHESLAAGSPELCLALDDALDRLAASGGQHRWLAGVSHTELLESAIDGAASDPSTIERLRDAVMSLAPFRSR